MEDVAIRVDNVSKNFRLPHEKTSSIKNLFVNVYSYIRKRRTYETQHALKNISFEIQKGEFFGIVGRNGSGKSTLLKMLAQIYQPTKGKIEIAGRLIPFIELGVGFSPELTGRENVYLNGALLGFSKQEIDEQYDEIVEFAELERFMDQKLKNYSSGMQVRLAFSMAVRAKADILLIDEVLAVGDADFQRKCFEYFKKLKKDHTTVVLVTHDMGAVREFCDRAMLIDQNKLVRIASPEGIAKDYTKLFRREEQTAEIVDAKSIVSDERWGDQKALYKKVKIGMVDDDSNILLTAEIIAKENVPDPTYGFMISNESEQSIMGTNSKIEQVKTSPLSKDEVTTISWKFPNIFNEGKYYVEIVILYNSLTQVADWWENADHFEVGNDKRTPYIVNPPVEFKSGKKNHDTP